jgi:TldD protein
VRFQRTWLRSLFAPDAIHYNGARSFRAELQTRGKGTVKELADAALKTAKDGGASYADIRINRYRNQSLFAREEHLQNANTEERFGFGVRVLVDGVWGFAASCRVSKDDVARVTAQAVATAKANASLGGDRVELVPVPRVVDTWQTPITKDPFRIALSTKADLLLALNQAALKAGASFVTSGIFAVEEDKYFASSDGSEITQLLRRIWPLSNLTVVDKASGRFAERNLLTTPAGAGWEYVEGYPLLEEVRVAAEQAKEKLTAKSVAPGKKDLVLSPEHLWLTIHESIGHPTELDRALGYEANFAGTSFVTTDQLGKLQYGSPLMNVVGDKVQAGGLATCGYDDDGVKTTEFDIIKGGRFVGYQTTREQVAKHGAALKDTLLKGCAYADDFASVPFQRMPNVSLKPIDAGGKKVGADELMASVKDGVLIEGAGSFSIDQQRYNFQFGGQVFHEIKNGKKGAMLRDVAYQAKTPQFWASLDGVGSPHFYKLGGSFFDGKGQPSQINAVSHGSSWARFRGVNVINTGRKI